MTDSGHIAQEDLALYAMGNLPLEEAAGIRAHLAACVLCREEQAETLGDLALLGLSLPLQPLPEGARERFLAAISTAQRSEPKATLAQVPRRVARRGWGYWAPWLVAAGLAITVVSLTLQNLALDDQLQGESRLVSSLAGKAARAQQVLEVLTAPDAQRVTLTLAKAARQPYGHATYLPDRGGLVFLANNLKPLPEDKTYELWVIPADGKAPIPAGLFRPDKNGAASLVLPPIPAGVPAKAFGVTIEKAAGSAAPTPPILLSGAASGS